MTTRKKKSFGWIEAVAGATVAVAFALAFGLFARAFPPPVEPPLIVGSPVVSVPAAGLENFESLAGGARDGCRHYVTTKREPHAPQDLTLFVRVECGERGERVAMCRVSTYGGGNGYCSRTETAAP